MKDILKFMVAFGFIFICGFILLTSNTIKAEENVYTETTPEIIPTIPETYLDTSTPLEIPIEEPVTVPVELSIDSIGVKAPIEAVGILDGAMAVPAVPENAGWYEFGTLPGDIGSAVLAGHVNWRNSPNAVFTNLKKVQIGDIITIKNSNEDIVYFMVNEIKSYPLYANTEDVFSSNDDLAHLNLITCDGLWNSIIRSHESRLVIFTSRI